MAFHSPGLLHQKPVARLSCDDTSSWQLFLTQTTFCPNCSLLPKLHSRLPRSSKPFRNPHCRAPLPQSMKLNLVLTGIALWDVASAVAVPDTSDLTSFSHPVAQLAQRDQDPSASWSDLFKRKGGGSSGGKGGSSSGSSSGGTRNQSPHPVFPRFPHPPSAKLTVPFSPLQEKHQAHQAPPARPRPRQAAAAPPHPPRAAAQPPAPARRLLTAAGATAAVPRSPIAPAASRRSAWPPSACSASAHCRWPSGRAYGTTRPTSTRTPTPGATTTRLRTRTRPSP